ncbi:MAG TPA: hypothetical protein VD995_32560 [Azospirillum sp.]|nr:hypothetical protein [Azospirillum sp.]
MADRSGNQEGPKKDPISLRPGTEENAKRLREMARLLRTVPEAGAMLDGMLKTISDLRQGAVPPTYQDLPSAVARLLSAQQETQATLAALERRLAALEGNAAGLSADHDVAPTPDKPPEKHGAYWRGGAGRQRRLTGRGVAKLREMHAQGMEPSAIVKELKGSLKTIKKRILELKLNEPVKSEHLIENVVNTMGIDLPHNRAEEFVDLLGIGFSDEELAVEFDIPKDQAATWRQLIRARTTMGAEDKATGPAEAGGEAQPVKRSREEETRKIQERRAEVGRLRADGLTWAAIARALKISDKAARNHGDALGLRKPASAAAKK